MPDPTYTYEIKIALYRMRHDPQYGTHIDASIHRPETIFVTANPADAERMYQALKNYAQPQTTDSGIPDAVL